MKKVDKFFRVLIIFVLCLGISVNGYSRKMHNKNSAYKLALPGSTLQIKDTLDNNEGDVYYDTISNVVLMINTRMSTFQSVSDYMDCANGNLEHMLQDSYGDTNLRIISCSRSGYYPGESTVVNFSLADAQKSMDTYTIYFIHYRKKDIQIALTTWPW